MEKSFTLGSNNENTVTVIFTWYGVEKYLINRKAVLSKWSLSPRGSREFKAGDQKVRVEVSCYPSDFYTKVYVDGELHIEELFPELKEKVTNSRRKGFGWKPFFKNLIIWFFIGMFGIILFNYLKTN